MHTSSFYLSVPSLVSASCFRLPFFPLPFLTQQDPWPCLALHEPVLTLWARWSTKKPPPPPSAKWPGSCSEMGPWTLAQQDLNWDNVPWETLTFILIQWEVRLGMFCGALVALWVLWKNLSVSVSIRTIYIYSNRLPRKRKNSMWTPLCFLTSMDGRDTPGVRTVKQAFGVLRVLSAGVCTFEAAVL